MTGDYVAHVPVCICGELLRLDLDPEDAPNRHIGTCPKCGKHYMVKEETRYHMEHYTG